MAFLIIFRSIINLLLHLLHFFTILILIEYQKFYSTIIISTLKNVIIILQGINY